MNIERQVEDHGKYAVSITPEMHSTLRIEYASLEQWLEMDAICPNIQLLLRKLIRPAFPEAEAIYSEE